MTWNKDRKQTKYGHKRQEQMTHTTEPWHNSPLPEGVSHAVTVPPGRGGGRLEAPQDRHGQEHRTGTSRAEQTDKGDHGRAGSSGGHGGAGSSGGHGGAGSSGGHGRWSLWPAPTAETLLPPNFPGEVRGYKEPSGAKQTGQYMDSPPGLNTQEQDRIGQPSVAKQTGTGQPTGTGSPPGLARRLRLLLGMTRSQRPSQGPSATTFISATREAGSWNGLRGHKTRSLLPQTSLHEQDRHDD